MKKYVHIDVTKEQLRSGFVSKNKLKSEYPAYHTIDSEGRLAIAYKNRNSPTIYYNRIEIEGLLERMKEEQDPVADKHFENETAAEPITITDSSPLHLIAYVDGSFNAATGTYGSGVVVLEGDTVLATYTQHGNDPELATMRNITGEIHAADCAVQAAKELLAESLEIRYDYNGIEFWATGQWGTNKEETQSYAERMQKAMKTLPISFRHVKAHTGDKYNEMADDLAQKAAGVVPLEAWVPEYAHEDVHISDESLTNEYDVSAECLLGIRKIKEKEKRSFGDYARLKTGRVDAFSGMRGEEFLSILDRNAYQYLTDNTHPGAERNNAMRWAARGLDAKDALLKTKVDQDLYGKQAVAGP